MNYYKELTAVIGDPVDDNPTAVVEQAAYDALGLPIQYLTIRVEKRTLAEAVAGMKAMNFLGFNVTMPHKLAILPLLDEITPEAEKIGAVNTVLNRNGRLIGANTDGQGFVENLNRNKISVVKKNILILGSGGVARSIAVGLAMCGVASICIAARNIEQGRALRMLLQNKCGIPASSLLWNDTCTIVPETDILINATPIGFLNPEEKPNISYSGLHDSMVLCDVVPNRIETPFLQEGLRRNCRVVNGLDMLTSQAALNFTLWTGKQAPFSVMNDVMKQVYGADN